MHESGNTAIQLTLTRKLLARVNDAAHIEGISRAEYVRRALLAAVERTDQLAARRARTAMQGRGR